LPWRAVFQELSRRYGWTPQQIGEMTLGQIFVYWQRAASPGESVECEPSAARQVAEKIKGQKAWWLARARRLIGLPPNN
jgi:hypothetical protein